MCQQACSSLPRPGISESGLIVGPRLSQQSCTAELSSNSSPRSGVVSSNIFDAACQPQGISASAASNGAGRGKCNNDGVPMDAHPQLGLKYSDAHAPEMYTGN
ncbi:hypothetical protein Tco_0561639 [Tanacetum coccineum]